MLSAGKISVAEAERLLQLTTEVSGRAADGSSLPAVPQRVADPRFIRIIVEPVKGTDHTNPLHHVNIRVPLKIVRAGVNLASLIPGEAGQVVQGSLLKTGYASDISKLDGSALDELIEALQELSIDATVDNHTVKVFVE